MTLLRFPIWSARSVLATFGRNFTHSAIRRGTETALVYNGHSYPYVWLRDACQCPSCLHPSTRQKLHRTSDIPPHVKPVPNGVHILQDGVRVTWESGHQSHYPVEFLDRYASPVSVHAFHRNVERAEWDVKRLKGERNLYLPYESLKTASGLLSAITQLNRYGLLFVTSVPNDKTSNEECELRTLGEQFGELRRTFYGETWDVKNIRNSRNIAYTNVDLGLHMDLLSVYTITPLRQLDSDAKHTMTDTSNTRQGTRFYTVCATASKAALQYSSTPRTSRPSYASRIPRRSVYSHPHP